MMKLQDILEREKLNKREVETDANGIHRIWVNDQHLIHLRSSKDEKLFYMYAKIASLPPEEMQAKVYCHLLEGNLFGKETGRAFLAVQAEAKAIVLMQLFDSEMTSIESYLENFQHFINFLVYWKKRMQDLPALIGENKSSGDVFQLMSRNQQKILFA